MRYRKEEWILKGEEERGRGTGSSRGKGNYDQDILYEKGTYFQVLKIRNEMGICLFHPGKKYKGLNYK